jgi:hypothetical protein
MGYGDGLALLLYPCGGRCGVGGDAALADGSRNGIDSLVYGERNDGRHAQLNRIFAAASEKYRKNKKNLLK